MVFGKNVSLPSSDCKSADTKKKIVFKSTHRGTQFGDVLSTSQVANNFMGTGLWGVEPVETSRRVPPVSAILSRSHCFGAVRLRIEYELPVKLGMSSSLRYQPTLNLNIHSSKVE